jgi:transketolase
MPHIYEQNYSFAIGKANVVRDGNDVSILACGIMVATALDAAALLKQGDIDARVIDMHTLRPMDRDAIERAARETGAIVTAEEHLLTGGMGSNIARVVSETFPVPMRFVGLQDRYVESADPNDLLMKYHLTARDVANAAREAVKAKRTS